MESTCGGKRGRGELKRGLRQNKKTDFAWRKEPEMKSWRGGVRICRYWFQRAWILASELASENIRGNKNQVIRELISMTLEEV